ncbi:MAG: hypothetical protein DRZ82_09360, partial [Thermoprotei archaeon]
MKVVIFKGDPSPYGGGTTFLQSLARALRSNGYEVVFLSEPCALKTLTGEFKDSDVMICYGYSKIHTMFRITSILKAYKRPVLYILGGTILIRKPNRPLYVLQNTESLSKLSLFRLLLRINSNSLRPYFAVHNRNDYSLLRGLVGNNVFLMPPAVDTQAFRPMTRNGVFTIVCNAAPASWVKGTDYLLRIIPRVLHALKEVRIIILTGDLGIIHFRNKLKTFEKKFPSKIRVIDKWLSPVEVASILGKSHLLVFPSRFEGFGILVLEA